MHEYNMKATFLSKLHEWFARVIMSILQVLNKFVGVIYLP